MVNDQQRRDIIVVYSYSAVKNLLPMQETQVQSLGQEDPLEKEMAAHSSILVWENPMDRVDWQATIHGVTKELDMT